VTHPEDRQPGLGAALACALIAQIVNVLVAALVAAQVPGGYRVRSWVFLAALLWSVAGTVWLLIRTGANTRGSVADQVRIGRIALWIASSWVWPLLVHRHSTTSQDSAPR
jgi:hypothetical protein